jgi:hypothetical protein
MATADYGWVDKFWTHSQCKLTVDIGWNKVETLNDLWTHRQYKLTVHINFNRWMACEPTANTSYKPFNVSTLYQPISSVNLYWLWVHKPFNVLALYQPISTVNWLWVHKPFNAVIVRMCLAYWRLRSRLELVMYFCLGTFIHRLSSTHWSSWGFDKHLPTFQLYINQLSTFNWFCCNTDNSTLVLHCISKYMKSS